MVYNRDTRLPIEMEFQSYVSDSDDLQPMDPQSNELEKRSKVMEDTQNKIIYMRRQKQTSSKLRIVKRNSMINVDVLHCLNVATRSCTRTWRGMTEKVAGLLKDGMVHIRFSSAWGKNTYKLQNSDGVALQKKTNGCNLK